jgi:hypothetical protein
MKVYFKYGHHLKFRHSVHQPDMHLLYVMYKSRKLDKKSLKMPTRLRKAGNRKSDNTWPNEKRQTNLKIVDNIQFLANVKIMEELPST